MLSKTIHGAFQGKVEISYLKQTCHNWILKPDENPQSAGYYATEILYVTFHFLKIIKNYINTLGKIEQRWKGFVGSWEHYQSNEKNPSKTKKRVNKFIVSESKSSLRSVS